MSDSKADPRENEMEDSPEAREARERQMREALKGPPSEAEKALLKSAKALNGIDKPAKVLFAEKLRDLCVAEKVQAVVIVLDGEAFHFNYSGLGMGQVVDVLKAAMKHAFAIFSRENMKDLGLLGGPKPPAA